MIETSDVAVATAAVSEMAGRMANTAFTFHNGSYFCIPKQGISQWKVLLSSKAGESFRCSD